MKEHIKKLVTILDHNRVRYKDVWEKVRRDRVHKLLPELSEQECEAVIQKAIEEGEIRECSKLVDKIHIVPAIKLNDFNYRRTI